MRPSQCAHPRCNRMARIAGLCDAHYRLGAPPCPAPETPVSAASAQRALQRAVDYATALLEDPHCIYRLGEAWSRACDASGIRQTPPVPPEVEAAAERRPTRRDTLDAIAISRPEADPIRALEVLR